MFSRALDAGESIIRSRLFWYCVFTILLIILLKRFWFKIVELTSPKYVESEIGIDGQPVLVDNARRKHLRELAERLYNLVRSNTGWDTHQPLEECLYLTDKELQYLAQYYKGTLCKNLSTLADDLDGEIGLWVTDLDNKVITRLRKIGEF